MNRLSKSHGCVLISESKRNTCGQPSGGIPQMFQVWMLSSLKRLCARQPDKPNKSDIVLGYIVLHPTDPLSMACQLSPRPGGNGAAQ